jgi:hypothetical protein
VSRQGSKLRFGKKELKKAKANERGEVDRTFIHAHAVVPSNCASSESISPSLAPAIPEPAPLLCKWFPFISATEEGGEGVRQKFSFKTKMVKEEEMGEIKNEADLATAQSEPSEATNAVREAAKKRKREAEAEAAATAAAFGIPGDDTPAGEGGGGFVGGGGGASADSSANADAPVGLGTCHHVMLQSKHQLTTASVVHVTNLKPPGVTTLAGSMVDTPVDGSQCGPRNQI